MTDRKSVISDLEIQIAWIRDNDFHKFPGWGHAVLAMKDAVTLLKAQEPRVMTFDEVKKHYNLPPVFPDDLEMQEDYYQDIQPLYFEFPNPCEWDVHWRGSNKVRTYLDEWEDRYNKTWRCWTSRPTAEDSQEVPWDD